MMKRLVVSLFSLFGLFFSASYAQEPGHVHKPHPHKHKQYAKEKSPVPLTRQSIEKGKDLFGKYCIICHGTDGRGSGNMNLTDDMVIHGDTEGEIFHVITDGVSGTTMKGFKKELTDEMRWHLVNYIGSLKTESGIDRLSARPGKHIRQTSIKEYTLMYHLLDLTERNKMMKKMEGHSAVGVKKVLDITNHLMVYIQKPDGKIMPGEVAYFITGPNGNDFTTMTMPMYGGYGADLSLDIKGLYTIRTNILIESKEEVKLNDEFTFQVD